AGLGTIVITFLTVRSEVTVRPHGAIAGLFLLAAGGPLALWSCSSLETASFALLLTLLVFAMMAGARSDTGWYDRLAIAAGIRAPLCRVDGAIYVAILLTAFWFYSSRRHELLAHVALPISVALAGYTLWRLLYFGDLLNMPAYSKVLYK